MTETPTTGYCSACGRGDLAPTADEYEQQRQRAEHAEAEVARLRASEEDGWDPACHPTPGQWIKRYNEATADKRLEYVARLVAAAEQGHTCVMSLHEERVRESWEAKTAIARVRALHRNEYGLCDECTGSHGVPWPCPTIRALDDEQPETTPAGPTVGGRG